jgi:hypothetical protein
VIRMGTARIRRRLRVALPVLATLAIVVPLARMWQTSRTKAREYWAPIGYESVLINFSRARSERGDSGYGTPVTDSHNAAVSVPALPSQLSFPVPLSVPSEAVTMQAVVS